MDSGATWNNFGKLNQKSSSSRRQTDRHENRMNNVCWLIHQQTTKTPHRR